MGPRGVWIGLQGDAQGLFGFVDLAVLESGVGLGEIGGGVVREGCGQKKDEVGLGHYQSTGTTSRLLARSRLVVALSAMRSRSVRPERISTRVRLTTPNWTGVR